MSKTARITLDDLTAMEWHMQPEDAGQIVQQMYAADEDYLYSYRHDPSDGSHEYSRAPYSLGAECEDRFEPWNGILPDCGDYEELFRADGHTPSAVQEMADVLRSRGDAFTGGVIWDAANEWCEEFGDADAADEWMDAGFWDASVAARVRDMGVTAQQAADRAAELEEAEDDPAEAYTDGSVVYSVCNRDTDLAVFAPAE